MNRFPPKKGMNFLQGLGLVGMLVFGLLMIIQMMGWFDKTPREIMIDTNIIKEKPSAEIASPPDVTKTYTFDDYINMRDIVSEWRVRDAIRMIFSNYNSSTFFEDGCNDIFLIDIPSTNIVYVTFKDNAECPVGYITDDKIFISILEGN